MTASASQVASARPTTATLQVKTVKKAATVTATANSTTATTAQSLQVANSTSAASQPVPVQSTSQAAQPAPAQSTSQAPAQSSQKVNTDELIAWFDNHKGQLTYSMTGNRDGSDGTADCSGAMTEALYEAGASKPAYLYNTDSLPGYLTANGYQLISTNTPWDAQRGDIVIWGQQGASGGAVGHVQVIISNDPNARAISVNYATQGAAGTAVTEWNYDTAYAQTSNGKFLPYYVYRQA
ncbi:lysin [Fructobacillus ficulneus]|uniref:Lysin n=1 Tax=Fructobacillus ficulneus TaxID=157463 RepID=A0A0K8MFZ5_9LACO|nr:lysin [Fructobacillus ficulneus]